jgi:hypothetical protein
MPFKISKEPPIYIIRVEVNSTLQMEAKSSFKMFVITDKTLQYHNAENYKLICELMLIREMPDYLL